MSNNNATKKKYIYIYDFYSTPVDLTKKASTGVNLKKKKKKIETWNVSTTPLFSNIGGNVNEEDGVV